MRGFSLRVRFYIVAGQEVTFNYLTIKLLEFAMKRYGLLILLACSFCSFAQSNNQTVLQKSLKDWGPISISEKQGVITVTLNEDRVTSQIYEAVIEMGVCPPLWFDAKKTSYLKNTKEIHVLNRHSYAGFVFEDPKSTCEAVGKAKGDDGKRVIAFHTHTH